MIAGDAICYCYENWRPSPCATMAWLSCALSSLLYIIAFASPDWIQVNNHEGQYEGFKLGIWTACYTTNTTVSFDVMVCGDLKEFILDPWNSGWVTGTQTVMCFGLISLACSVITVNSYLFLPSLKGNIAPAFISMCADFAAAVFLLIGIIVFGTKKSSNFSDAVFSWAFVLAVGSTILVLVSAIFLLADFIDTNDARIPKVMARRLRARQAARYGLNGTGSNMQESDTVTENTEADQNNPRGYVYENESQISQNTRERNALEEEVFSTQDTSLSATSLNNRGRYEESEHQTERTVDNSVRPIAQELASGKMYDKSSDSKTYQGVKGKKSKRASNKESISAHMYATHVNAICMPSTSISDTSHNDSFRAENNWLQHRSDSTNASYERHGSGVTTGSGVTPAEGDESLSSCEATEEDKSCESSSSVGSISDSCSLCDYSFQTESVLSGKDNLLDKTQTIVVREMKGSAGHRKRDNFVHNYVDTSEQCLPGLPEII